MIDVNRIKGLISYMTFYVVGKNAILLFVAIFDDGLFIDGVSYR